MTITEKEIKSEELQVLDAITKVLDVIKEYQEESDYTITNVTPCVVQRLSKKFKTKLFFGKKGQPTEKKIKFIYEPIEGEDFKIHIVSEVVNDLAWRAMSNVY